MPREYKSSWWAIEFPPGWNAENEEDCVTFSAERGVGALQISAYRRDVESVTDNDLNDFAADELVNGITPEDVSWGDFRGKGISYVEADSFWRKLWLRAGSLLLYITYNCAAEDHAIEVESVNQMLNSLKSRMIGEA